MRTGVGLAPVSTSLFSPASLHALHPNERTPLSLSLKAQQKTLSAAPLRVWPPPLRSLLALCSLSFFFRPIVSNLKNGAHLHQAVCAAVLQEGDADPDGEEGALERRREAASGRGGQPAQEGRFSLSSSPSGAARRGGRGESAGARSFPLGTRTPTASCPLILGGGCTFLLAPEVDGRKQGTQAPRRSPAKTGPSSPAAHRTVFFSQLLSLCSLLLSPLRSGSTPRVRPPSCIS